METDSLSPARQPRGRPRGFDRETALDAATLLFWRQGYDATSTAELCSAMGINPPSLYAAFGSKEALYEAALARYVTCQAPRIWDGFAAAPTAREAIGALLRDTATAFSAPGQPRWCMVTLSELREQGSDRLGALVASRRAEALAMIEERLLQARHAGEIGPDLAIRDLARFYLGVQQGMSLQARDGAPDRELMAMAETAIAAWPSLTAPPAQHAAKG